MVIPKKHLTIEESQIGFGAYLLNLLSKPMTVDLLWEKYKIDVSNMEYTFNFSFDDFLITIDFLFLIGAIEEKKGDLYRETNKTRI